MRRGIGFGDPDGVGGGGESEAIEHILPPQPIFGKLKVECGKWEIRKYFFHFRPSTLRFLL